MEDAKTIAAIENACEIRTADAFPAFQIQALEIYETRASRDLFQSG